MPFKDAPIQGVQVRDLCKHVDPRGWLMELFRADEIGSASMPAMSYLSSTGPGVVRGPHEHREQADFFCFVGPSNFRIYLWDNRRGSPTYEHRMILNGGEDAPRAVLIPAGVVHAYKNIGSREGWSINFPDRLYAGRGRREAVDEIRHENDPETPFRVD